MYVLLLRAVICAFIVFSATGYVWAVGSGGYRLEVADAGAAGKGSAFVGEANTPAAVFYNPAGMTQISGSALSMGAALIQPYADYKSTTGQESQSRRHNFGIPAAFFVTDLGTQNVALGFGALSSWGLGTEWHADSFARYTATKSTMKNEDYIMALAYQMSEQVSLSIGLNIDHSMVDKHKKLAQGSGVDGDFRLKGSDMAYGYTLAAMYKLNDRHQFGVTYRSEMELKYKGKVMLNNLDSSATVDVSTPSDNIPDVSYQSIFGSSYETDVIAKVTLPDSIVFGYSYQPTDKWTVNADLEWMNWGTTNKEELAYPSLNASTDPSGLQRAVLNNGNPASRDWISQWSLALGTQYDLTERFSLRGGYYYRRSPIPNANWEPNLPDANSHGFTLGTGVGLTQSLDLDLAWSGIWYEKRKISNAVADAYGGIDGEYSQWVNLLYATVTYNF